jgi:hypothetical protein
VHMRVRPGTEGVAFGERDRHVRRMAVPVGDGDGAEDDVPARVRVVEPAPQPSPAAPGCRRRSWPARPRPDRRRMSAAAVPSFPRPERRPPGERGYRSPWPRSRRPPRPSGRCTRRRRPQRGPAGEAHWQHPAARPGRQQRLLVMRRHDHADRLDRAEPVAHTRPIAWATDAGVPSVRM